MRSWRMWKVAAALVVALVTLVGPALTSTGEAQAAPGRGASVAAKVIVQGDRVTFTGRTRARAVVRVQMRTDRWRTVRSIRATRSGSYRVAVARPSVVRTYRVVSAGRTHSTSTVRPVTRAAAPAPAPVAKAPSDACGTRPRKADGTYWACSFNDEFAGSALDATKWTPSTGPADGYCAVDDPSLIRVSNGSLRLGARRATSTLKCPVDALGLSAPYVTGSVSTFWKYSQQYGRYEVRMRNTATTAPGLHEAFWLWPDIRYNSVADWPVSGEIDVVETYSQHPGLAIPFLHYTYNDNGGPVPGLNTAWNCTAPRGYWHTYTLDWTAEKVVISVDGRTCLTNYAGASSFRKPFIIVLSQLMGVGGNAPTSATPSSATLEVDYVRAWQ